MTLGNVLTFISIIIAVFSFAFNSNRRIIFFKFSYADLILGTAVIVVVSYLLMFDLMAVNGWYVKSLYIVSDRLPLPSQWAYIISILSLIYLSYKSFVSKYIPNSRREGLMNYYNELINEDIPLLISYLRSYHQNEIKNLIDYLNFLEDKEHSFCKKAKHLNRFHEKRKASNKGILDIIFNLSFIRGSIEKHHELYFLETTKQLTNINVVGYKKAVQYYYNTLLTTSNNTLVEALNNTNNFLDEHHLLDVSYRLYEYRFSELTFSDIHYVESLDIYRVFGEEGMKSASKDSLFRTRNNEWLEDDYKKTCAYLNLCFYDILIRQIIYAYIKNPQDIQRVPNVYPYYLYLICDEAIKNTGANNYVNSFAERLVSDTQSVVYQLLDTSIRHSISYGVYSLAFLLNSFVELSSLNTQEKTKFGVWILEVYLSLAAECKDAIIKEILNKELQEGINKSRNIMSISFQKIDNAKYVNYPDYKFVATFFKS